jgi:hypothetical protein
MIFSINSRANLLLLAKNKVKVLSTLNLSINMSIHLLSTIRLNAPSIKSSLSTSANSSSRYLKEPKYTSTEPD